MIPLPMATPIKTRTTLVDITKCIGCRACQVACKQWNDRDGEETELQPDLGFQNPAVLAGRPASRQHDVALPALPRAGVRVFLPDNGARSAIRRTGQLRRRQVHRLPILHVGVPMGRAVDRLGHAPAQDP